MVAGAQPDSGGYLSPGIAGMVGVSPEFDIYGHPLLRTVILSIQTLSLFFLHLPPPFSSFPFFVVEVVRCFLFFSSLFL
jgi:hypothetical protein